MSALAIEMQQLVRSAAEPVAPGETVKAQMRRAWAVLGRPPYWRLRAAWYGEAGCWSGAAVLDFQSRARARETREAKARDSAGEAAAALVALRRAYASSGDQDFHRGQIVAIDAALAAMGADDRAVDAAGSGT